MTTTPAPNDLDTLRAKYGPFNDRGGYIWRHMREVDADMTALLDELANSRREVAEAFEHGLVTASMGPAERERLHQTIAEAERERDAARKELANTQARVATLDERVTTWKTRLVEETATLREELAKTRAELETARLELATVTESADEATRQADGRRDEIDRLRAEQGTATTPRTYRDMPVYPCGKVGRGIAHMAHVYGVGKAEVACNGLPPHPVPLANPATTAEPAAPHCGLCGSETCPGKPGEGCMPGPFETYEPDTKVTGTTQTWPDFADQCVTTHTGSTRAGNDAEPAAG